MAKNPVILIHGYSDRGKSFEVWRDILRKNGYTDVKDVSICSYESLTNEVTIKDIAEAFDRALRVHAHLGPNDPFDAIVHSTGMLVVRAWLTSYSERQRRLKRLIGLSPATFGSPLAHQGRSLLGAIFKGNKMLGPDFLEAGDKVLDGLELGSRFTWDLAHLDLLPYDIDYNPFAADKVHGSTFYGSDDTTPYVFVFCGTTPYGGIRKVVNQPGTDGTVRWAGCSLRTRKITLDLTQERKNPNAAEAAPPAGKRRFAVLRGTNIDIPLVPVSGLNHGEMLSQPTDDLVKMVVQALGVSSSADFTKWHDDWKEIRLKGYRELNDSDTKGGGNWAQFVVRAVDERGDPVSDFHLQLFKENDQGDLADIEMDAYAYKADSSFVCYHVDLNQLGEIKVGEDLPDEFLGKVHARVIASSGSQLVSYYGYGSEKEAAKNGADGVWDATLDFAKLERTADATHLFRPFTTTLIELKLNREPLPLDVAAKNRVCYWEEV